jgi:hypothetical protein
MTQNTRAVLLAGAAFLCTSSLVSPAHAEWQCPYFNWAYYPSVVSCPNWRWDPNGPQARVQAAQEEAAATRAKAAAAAQAREQARAEQDAIRERARAEQDAIRAAKAAADRQNSPNNLCRDPDVARQLITDFNSLATWQPEAVDIEHLTTNVGVTAKRNCHGIFVLTNGRRLEGNLIYRKNVAGDTIVAWVDGGAASLPEIAPSTAPSSMPPHQVADSTAPTNDTQPAPIKGDAMFQKGLSDRTSWETWFNGLQGDQKTGAFYWTGQRSLSHPGSCQQMNSAVPRRLHRRKEPPRPLRRAAPKPI